MDNQDLVLTHYLAMRRKEALDAERRYLGAAMFLGQRSRVDVGLLRDSRHVTIAKAIQDDPEDPPNLGTIVSYLYSREILEAAGGVAYVAQLTSTELAPFFDTARADLADAWKRYDLAKILTAALDDTTKGKPVETIIDGLRVLFNESGRAAA